MKGMFKPKRIIALLLSIALCLSLLPGVDVAQAAENELFCDGSPIDLSSLQTTDGNGYPVYRFGNRTYVWNVNQDTTMGFKMLAIGSNCRVTINIAAGVTLTLNDSTGNGGLAVNNGATLVVNGLGAGAAIKEEKGRGGTLSIASYREDRPAKIEVYGVTVDDIEIGYGPNNGRNSLIVGEDATVTKLSGYEGDITIKGSVGTYVAGSSTYKGVVTIDPATAQIKQYESDAASIQPVVFASDSELEEEKISAFATKFQSNYVIVKNDTGDSILSAILVSELMGNTVIQDYTDLNLPAAYSNSTFVDEANNEVPLPHEVTGNTTLYTGGLLTVTANDVTKTYDGQPHGITVSGPAGTTVLYGTEDGVYNSAASPTLTDVGSLTVYWKATLGSQTETGSNTVTIAPREVTVKAKNLSIEYGDPEPTLEYEVTSGSVVSGETLNGITLSRTAGTAIGTYEITLTLDGNANPNYTVTDGGGGTLTITKRTVTVTAGSLSKTYGEDDPELTYTVDNLLDGHTLSAISVSRAEGENKGTYPITPSVTGVKVMSGETDVTENYEVKAMNGTFTINPRPVTVTVNNATKVYGDADPTTFGYTVKGLRSGDSAAVTLSRADGETAGEYDINVGDVTIKDGETDVTANYVVTKVNGIFTITKRPLTVYVENEFLEINSGQGYIEGKLLSREPLVAGHTLSGSVIVNNNEDVNYGDPGRYPLTPANVTISDNEGRNVTDNYDIVTEDGTLVIDYKRIIITIPDQIEVGVSGKISVDLTYADDSLRVLNLAIKSENGLKLISPGMSKEDGLPYSLEIADANRENNQMWGISIETTTINTIAPAEENGWADWSIPNMGQMMTGYGLNPLLEYNITATLADGAAPKYAGEYTDTLTFIVCPEEYTYADYGNAWDPWDTSLWYYGTII